MSSDDRWSRQSLRHMVLIFHAVTSQLSRHIMLPMWSGATVRLWRSFACRRSFAFVASTWMPWRQSEHQSTRTSAPHTSCLRDLSAPRHLSSEFHSRAWSMCKGWCRVLAKTRMIMVFKIYQTMFALASFDAAYLNFMLIVATMLLWIRAYMTVQK